MLRWLCVAACFAVLLSAGAARAEPVALRERVEARGAQITMGDVFAGAPADVALRPIAPAPAPGQVGVLPMSLLAVAASAAGLEWTPPAGLTEVRVVRPGGARAMVAPAGGGPGARPIADAAVRRGEPVTLVLNAPNIAITLGSARAMDNGAVGERVRVINPSSERVIDAVVTGPGQARVNP